MVQPPLGRMPNRLKYLEDVVSFTATTTVLLGAALHAVTFLQIRKLNTLTQIMEKWSTPRIRLCRSKS